MREVRLYYHTIQQDAGIELTCDEHDRADIGSLLRFISVLGHEEMKGALSKHHDHPLGVD